MRVSMKPCKPYNLPSSTTTPHVKQHCSSTLTQQVSFTPRQHSPKNLESFLDPNPQSVHHSTSPRRLGKRWMEYMGVEDWAGLLDPLDDNLRSEISRYGSFVEAAYRAFDFDPSSPSYGSCKHSKKSLLEKCGFHNMGYRETCNLRATSGIQVPDWARSSWPGKQTSWIGYVAVCQDKAMIHRLGRRDVVIALRGTATCLEWLENLCATLTPISGHTLKHNVSPSDRGVPMVESGFLSLYTSRTQKCPSLQDTLRSEIERILELYPDEPLSFTITGHSLGAALATLAAYDIKNTFERAPLITVISFGGPRVGNQSFRSIIEKQGTKILRIVNPSDLITKVPGFVIDNNEYDFTSDTNHNSNVNNKVADDNGMHPLTRLWSNWIQKRVEDTQWVYAEVGCELRLTSQEPEQPPYYLSNMNIAKCHDLKTYLKLVAEGVSSNCPLRATVKRYKQTHHNNQRSTVTVL